jgi:rubrerythrin
VPGNQWADLLDNIKSAVNECDKCIELVRWQFLDLVIRQQKQDIQHALETIQENENRNEKVLAWASEVRNQDDYQFVCEFFHLQS